MTVMPKSWINVKQWYCVKCRPLTGKHKYSYLLEWSRPIYKHDAYMSQILLFLEFIFAVTVCIFKCFKKLCNDARVCLCQMADAEMHLETSPFLPSCCVSVSLALLWRQGSIGWRHRGERTKDARLMTFAISHQISFLATCMSSSVYYGWVNVF